VSPGAFFLPELGDALGCANGRDIDRDAFVNGEVKHPIDYQIHHLIGIVHIDHGRKVRHRGIILSGANLDGCGRIALLDQSSGNCTSLPVGNSAGSMACAGGTGGGGGSDG
jgi:hypothetical protein